jgi:hypothetical protein
MEVVAVLRGIELLNAKMHVAMKNQTVVLSERMEAPFGGVMPPEAAQSARM